MIQNFHDRERLGTATSCNLRPQCFESSGRPTLADKLVKLNVAIVYHLWPHYRTAVMSALDRSDSIEFSFFGSGQPLLGIKHADINCVKRFRVAPFRYIGPFLWQARAARLPFEPFDAIIYLGDPNFLTTWAGALIAKFRGVPVLFWAHGWLRPERRLKRIVRNIFFGLSSRVLVYSNRGKSMGVMAGFPADKITVVYNSLDVERANNIIYRIENGSLNTVIPQDLFDRKDLPVLVCSARLTKLCRFDILFEAADKLRNHDTPVNILLVGDGPERSTLEKDAERLGISVRFFGACYDEEVLGQLIYHSDVTVSPGKIGLTAMHSLMYGTPAITHSSLDDQMPEVESITPGKTGSLFVRNDASSLAKEIFSWLHNANDRAAVRAAARQEIRVRWSPINQATIIEQALREVVHHAKA